MRAVAEENPDLVTEHGGVNPSEHGTAWTAASSTGRSSRMKLHEAMR
ncbi:hypothetical protein [Saccharopolyspora sp. ASAGF58]|nr:hypothetical protein [Saccharopolyspora sp. ASAGF58]